MRTEIGFPAKRGAPAPQTAAAAPHAPRNKPAIWLGIGLVAMVSWHWHALGAADDRAEKICTALAAYTAAASERVPPAPDLTNADDRYRDIDSFYRAEMWDEYRFISSDDPAARRLTLTRASLMEIDRACGVVR